MTVGNLSKLLIVNIIIAYLFFLFLPNASAAEVTLLWDQNPESVVPDYYTVYYGTTSKNYSHSKVVYTGTSCPVTGLEEGVTYYFSVTAGADGFGESEFSDEISYTVARPRDFSISTTIVIPGGGLN